MSLVYFLCFFLHFQLYSHYSHISKLQMHGQNELFVKLLYFTRVSIDFGVIIPSQMPMTFS